MYANRYLSENQTNCFWLFMYLKKTETKKPEYCLYVVYYVSRETNLEFSFLCF